MRHGEPEGGTGLPGLAHACAALDSGDAAVVPNPPPMSYGVVATAAWRVNAAKGRALDQNVAASVHHPAEWHRLASVLDLPQHALHASSELLRLHLTVLLPLRREASPCGWFAPAVRDGQACVFDGRWAPTAALWDRYPRLYGSSANRTGMPPATSAAEARAYFGSDCAVVDGDALGGPSPARTASTIVRLDRRGRLSLHRSGAHDPAQRAGPAGYLRQLAELTGLPADTCSN